MRMIFPTQDHFPPIFCLPMPCLPNLGEMPFCCQLLLITQYNIRKFTQPIIYSQSILLLQQYRYLKLACDIFLANCV